MKFPTYEEMAKDVAEKALDEYIYQGKTLREWVQIISENQDSDCISREAARDLLYHKQEPLDEFDLDTLPSVTPKPKTGYWIYKIYGGYPECGDYYCSECDKIDNRTPTYCPNCGAKMERSDNK